MPKSEHQELIVVVLESDEEAQLLMLGFLFSEYPNLEERIQFQWDTWKGLSLVKKEDTEPLTQEEWEQLQFLDKHANVLQLDTPMGEGSLG